MNSSILTEINYKYFLMWTLKQIIKYKTMVQKKNCNLPSVYVYRLSADSKFLWVESNSRDTLTFCSLGVYCFTERWNAFQPAVPSQTGKVYAAGLFCICTTKTKNWSVVGCSTAERTLGFWPRLYDWNYRMTQLQLCFTQDLNISL